MPLEKSSSKAALEKNIKKEIEAGKEPDQAAAIAYSEQREARSEGNAAEVPSALIIDTQSIVERNKRIADSFKKLHGL